MVIYTITNYASGFYQVCLAHDDFVALARLAAAALAAIDGRAGARLRGADAPLPDAAADRRARQGPRRQRRAAQQRVPDDRRAAARRVDRGAKDRARGEPPRAHDLRGDRRGPANAARMAAHGAVDAGTRVPRLSGGAVADRSGHEARRAARSARYPRRRARGSP